MKKAQEFQRKKKSKDKDAIENGPAVRIKVESPIWRDFKTKLKALNTGKGLLSKIKHLSELLSHVLLSSVLFAWRCALEAAV